MTKNYNKLFKINHNPNWPYISDHPYRMLIIGGSGSGKIDALTNLIKHQWPDFDKIYLYIKDPLESRYELLINEREIECSNWKFKKIWKSSLIIHN